MPLKSGTSEQTIAENAMIEMKHGKSRKQAFAIAYAVARRKKRKESK